MKKLVGNLFGVAVLGIALVGLTGCLEEDSKSRATELSSGETVSGSIRSSWKHYSIKVPDGATRLRVVATTTKGQTDLLVNHGKQPDQDMAWRGDADCKSWTGLSNGAVCDSANDFTLKTGTYYISLFDPSSSDQYELTATVTGGNTRSAEKTDDDAEAALQIAWRYLKHQRQASDGATDSEEAPVYPESGLVQIVRASDSYRFYFGSDATTPAVLSIDHNGQWTSYMTWDEFEADMTAR